MREKIAQHLNHHIQVFQQAVLPLTADIESCAQKICQTLQAGNKILIMGNGGSAADSQHFAAELVGRFLKNRSALPAIALSTDTSILTAVGNDFGFEKIFSRQIEALAMPGDLVLGISTSGNSGNVRSALQLAKDRGCFTMALTGRDGGSIAASADLSLNIAVEETPRIQEAHLTLIHILCDLIESELFPN